MARSSRATEAPTGAHHPRVSILLPCRDAAAYLPSAIGSMQRQTMRDFEIVAVDDGSADATPHLLEAWAARDPRVRVLRSPRPGITEALNAAIGAATASLIARMDADDVMEPDRLERQLAWLEAEPGLAGCGTRVRCFPSAQVRDGARRYEAWLNGLMTPEDVARDAFVECPVAHPTLMLRRAALDSITGYRDPGWPEDYDLVLRLLSCGHRLGNVPAVLHHWRERPDRATRTDARYSIDAFARCKAHFLAGSHLVNRDPILCGAGPAGKRLARALIGEGVGIRAFVELDPRKIGQRIHGAPVIGYGEIGRHRDAYFLGAVAGALAREAIRSALRDAGLREIDDFRAAA